MGTTTISLKDEAYRRLREAKRDDESFSDVMIRLTDSAKIDERIEELEGGLGTELAREVEDSSPESILYILHALSDKLMVNEFERARCRARIERAGFTPSRE